MARKIIFFIIVYLFFPFFISAEDTNLIYPRIKPERYNQEFSSLNKKQRWRMRIHGLRNAALHPDVWAVRRRDKTDNRALIPIRTFYLKESENPEFKANKIVIKFRFDNTSEEKMLTQPHLHDPVLDVSFGGEYIPAIKGNIPERDRSYVLRLTAFPFLQSGIYYRSQLKYKKLTSIDRVNVGEVYKLTIQFSDSEAIVKLNDKEISRFKDKNINSGLVGLASGWHTTQIRELRVAGNNFDASGLLTQVKY